MSEVKIVTMGSLSLQPEDIVNYAENSETPLNNFTTICVAIGRVNSFGIFHQSDPFKYAVPLLLVQSSLAIGIILLVSLLLTPLRQPLVVKQLFAAIILGPTVLCRYTPFAKLFFPLEGYIVMDALASFGFIFYFFLIGLQIDPWIFRSIQRKAYPLGFFSVAVPMVLTTCSFFLVTNSKGLDESTDRSLPAVVQCESLLAFPVIAQILAELKILNSEFGRVAISSSLVAGICSVAMMATTVLWSQQTVDNIRAIQTISNSVVLGLLIVFAIRPLVLGMIKRNPEGEPLKQSCVLALLVAVMMSSFCSQALGLNIYFGPLVFGITIPAGPPIGSALVDKLDLITNWMFMPLYFIKIGLIINIFEIELKNYLIVQFMCLVGAFGKFIGTFVVALCVHIPLRDAVSLGLLMTAQGVLELAVFKVMKNTKALNSQAFMIMSVNMMLVSGAITPIIRYLYDPTRRYVVYTRRTVMHSKPDSELRVMVCIHDQENVPTIINLLEALNPTTRSPLSIFVLHLIELVGHARPLLIPHMPTKRPSRNSRSSEHIVNVFRRFEQSKDGLLTVHPFIAISPYKTMHDDVCTIALTKSTSLVIIPFYKRLAAAFGTIGFCNKSIKMTNNNILEKVPCSIAILVDRSFVGHTSRPVLDSWSSYRVAVLFLGGPDDREALSLAARMAEHHKINLTIIRLLENGNISSSDESERRLDNTMVSEFRTNMATNRKVRYVEEVVMDGTGTISVIRSMENNYELVIIGRHHDIASPLLYGLTDWNDDKELGTIGDVLASAEFLGNTSLLIVQQHINVLDSGAWIRAKCFKETKQEDEEAEDLPIHKRST